MITYIDRLHTVLVGVGIAIVGVDSDGIVSPANLQAAAQPIIDAFDDTEAAQLAFENAEERAKAVADVDNSRVSNQKLLRAIAAVLLDELNLHADKMNAILTAIDSGGTLAQVKNNIAAIADYPQRTMPQLVTAIKNKINAGTVD